MKDKIPIIIGNKESVFVVNLKKQLSKKEIDANIFDPFECEGLINKFRLLKKLYLILRFILFGIFYVNKKHTVVFCYLSVHLSWMAPIVKVKSKKLIGIAFGSDVLRRNKKLDFAFLIGLRFFNSLYATNGNVICELNKILPRTCDKIDVGLIKFGLPVLDILEELIKKEELKQENKKFNVVIGYASESGQMHKEVIAAIYENYHKLEHCKFTLPLQYGSTDYKEEIIEFVECINNSVSFELFNVVDDFYDDERMAAFRMSTDIMVNNSLSDAFSGSVQETIFSEGIVMARSRLPYDSMPGYGSSIVTYNNMGELIDLLDKRNIEVMMLSCKSKINSVRRDLIEMSSWRKVINQWVDIL